MQFQNFVGGTYALANFAANAERAVNVYPESVGGAGKSKVCFRVTPGSTTWATVGSGPIRAISSDVGPDDSRGGAGRSLYAISGDTLYQVFGDGTSASRGNVGNDGRPAFIYPNGTQFFIISAGNAFIWDGITLASAPVPADDTIDSAFPGGQVGTATSGAFMDGYFIATKQDSNRFFHSALNNGLLWDELDFATCESHPDRIERVLADHGELYFFGNRTTEVWRNEGDADNVFRRDPNGTIPIGIAAVASAVNLVDGPAWIGANAEGAPIAWRGRGLMPVRISTYAVEQAWAGYTTVADAIGYTYTEDGHSFWVLTFPAGNATWVYDFKENMWHERAWWNTTVNERQRGVCHAYQETSTPTVGMRHLVGDRANGKIYRSSTSILSDDGVLIHRTRQAPHLHDGVNQLFYHEFQTDIHDPTNAHSGATLEWSNDNVTWNTPRTAGTSSAIEGKLRRLKYRRLGCSRNRIFRQTFTAAAPLVIVDAYLEVTKGTS